MQIISSSAGTADAKILHKVPEKRTFLRGSELDN